jgi:putative transposase
LAAVAREVRVAEELVHRDFALDAPDRRWFADLTGHPTDAGKLYLASVLGAFDKQIVGWSIGENATSSLVVNAARDGGRAPQSGHPTRASSDRGTRNTSIAFTDRLAQLGLTPSMGSRGDADGNAVIESWHATLQTELLDRRQWRTRDEFRTALFHFIEVFYNGR